jgi:hypothetical protein
VGKRGIPRAAEADRVDINVRGCAFRATEDAPVTAAVNP